MPFDKIKAEALLSSDESDDNDMNYDLNGLTDVEDLDEDSKNIAKKKQVNDDDFLTDVEDYNFSEAENSDEDIPFPEPMISLQEFLDQGQSNEEIDHGNGVKVRKGVKVKKGKFGIRQESVDSENEIDTESEDHDVSACDPEDILSTVGDLDEFLPELYRDDVKDVVKDSDDEDISEDDVISCASEAGICPWGDVSDVEDLTGSEKEEVFKADSESECSMSASDVESPPIELEFSSMTGRKKNRKGNFNKDENLTDVEGLDSGTGSDSDIPVAMVMKSRGSVTDFEGLEGLDVEEPQIKSVSETYIPQTTRELVIVKPNHRGDDITSVLPLEGNPTISICALSSGNATDIESYSDIDERISDVGSVAPDILDCIESDVVKNTEAVKSPKSPIKKDFLYEGQLTDTEELFMEGPSQKRRQKGKNKPRNKALDSKPPAYNESVTDVEDFDFGCLSHEISVVDKDPFKTDVEYVTGEESSDSRAEVAETYLKLDSYCSSISTINSVSPSKERKPLSVSSTYNMPHFLRRDDLFSQHLTDVEDFQLPSDCEETKPLSFIPIDIQCFIGDATTIINDMDQQPFDIEKEKMYIKGMNLNESVTDVESVDDEVFSINLQKNFHSMRM